MRPEGDAITQNVDFGTSKEASRTARRQKGDGDPVLSKQAKKRMDDEQTFEK